MNGRVSFSQLEIETITCTLYSQQATWCSKDFSPKIVGLSIGFGLYVLNTNTVTLAGIHEGMDIF